MRLLDHVWFRYTLLFLFSTFSLALMPQPIPWLGAMMWVLAAVAARQKVNDRPAILERSLQSIAAYGAALLAYKFLKWGLTLEGLAVEMGVPLAEAEPASAAWAHNTALVALNLSFLIPAYYVIYWGRMMFWDRLSVLFRPTAPVEDIQAILKRGGHR